MHKALCRCSVMLIKQFSSRRDCEVTCHPQTEQAHSSLADGRGMRCTVLSTPPSVGYLRSASKNRVLPRVCVRIEGIFKHTTQINSQCLPDWKWLEVGWLSKRFSLMKGRGHDTECHGLCSGGLSLRSLPALTIFALKQAFPRTILPALLHGQLNSAPCCLSKSTAVMAGHLVGSGKPREYKDTESSWAANHWGLGEHSMAGGKSSLALFFGRQLLWTPSLSGYHVALTFGHIW